MEQNIIMPANQLSRMNNEREEIEDAIIVEDNKHFITANSQSITMESLKRDNIVPVFSRDNEVLVSHPSFIEATYQAAVDYYHGEKVNKPQIRVSHIIKGRIPEAINKRANELLPKDKTQYYERMAFAIDIPTITENINGNTINLSIVGVKSYGRDNLNGKIAPQKFSLAVGFSNQVCCNLCIFGENYWDDILAISTTEIYRSCLNLLQLYDMSKHLYLMKSLADIYLKETQFALLLGRMRMYNYLPLAMKRGIPQMLINDYSVNAVAKHYFHDDNFQAQNNGEISMWNFYNLLTGAVKNSYIDVWLGREANSMDTSLGIASALRKEDSGYGWFIS